MTGRQKDELADIAMMLREEQVQARVVHYKAELETSPELDAITAQVVEQLKQLQAQVNQTRPHEDRSRVQHEQVSAMRKLLHRIFQKDAPSLLLESKLKEIARRVTRLFFESELAERVTSTQERLKMIHHAEQGVFYVLNRFANRMRADLEGFEYIDNDIREQTFDLLDKTSNELRVAFLSRRSPEVKRLIATFTQVLAAFFQDGFPEAIDSLSEEVVHATAESQGNSAMGYKILHQAFPAFRQAFERRFLVLLIGYVEDRLVKALQKSSDDFRDDTIDFVRSPELYRDVCAVMSDALYEQLCNEGFLDLPVDWRSQS